VYCALSTVCKVTVKRPLLAVFEVVASLCNVDKIYIQGEKLHTKMKQNSNNSSDDGTAVGKYAAGNCAGHVSLLHTEMRCRDDPSCMM
jgi:hypothetical protein